jgi:hypothetical protein
VLLETETDTERRENVFAARFRDTERESAGVGLRVRVSPLDDKRHPFLSFPERLLCVESSDFSSLLASRR